MNRGILATCYARPTGAESPPTLLDACARPTPTSRSSWSANARRPPRPRSGSNAVHVTARYDERTGWVVALAALDNLTKGAAGQALQCANLLLGLPEAAGLPATGVYP